MTSATTAAGIGWFATFSPQRAQPCGWSSGLRCGSGIGSLSIPSPTIPRIAGSSVIAAQTATATISADV